MAPPWHYSHPPRTQSHPLLGMPDTLLMALRPQRPTCLANISRLSQPQVMAVPLPSDVFLLVQCSCSVMLSVLLPLQATLHRCVGDHLPAGLKLMAIGVLTPTFLPYTSDDFAPLLVFYILALHNRFCIPVTSSITAQLRPIPIMALHHKSLRT